MLFMQHATTSVSVSRYKIECIYVFYDFLLLTVHESFAVVGMGYIS